MAEPPINNIRRKLRSILNINDNLLNVKLLKLFINVLTCYGKIHIHDDDSN